METSTKFITIGSSDLIRSQTKFQVIVIGAGLSGLSAAKWLQEWDVHNLLVLEARDRVGGRTLTKKSPDIRYVDFGGSYVGPSQNHILRIAKDLGVQTHRIYDPDDAGKVFYTEKYGRSIHYGNSLPHFWNPLIHLDLNHLFRLMDKMGEEIPADAPWNAPHAEEWDRMSIREFSEKNLYTKGGREFMETLCNAFATCGTYEASLLWFLWYIKQGKGCDRIFSTMNGAQERKFVGGSQQISEKIADMLGSKLMLNKVVCEIDQRGSSVSVSTLDGSEYEADYVILAIPLPMQLKIHYKPSLPPLRNQLIQKAPMGSAFKIHMYYERCFWREKGLSGTAIIVGGPDHPVGYTFDDTKPDGSHPALVGFFGGERARNVLEKTPEERKWLIAQSFSKVFESPEALEPVHYEEFNWMPEQYSGGCYTTHYPPGVFATHGKILREPIGKIFFAGTETSVVWSGYMDGAIAAGERAAREILHALGKISSYQIWREEPESKEFPALPFPKSFINDHLPSAFGLVRFFSWSSLFLGLGAGLVLFHRVYRLAR